MNYLNTSYSQAHLQFAQADTQSKIATELVCLPLLFCRPEKQNQFSAKIENEEVVMKGIENQAGNILFIALLFRQFANFSYSYYF